MICSMLKTWHFRFAFCLATALAGDKMAVAQAQSDRPVILAIVDQFPREEARAMLVRYPHSSGRDMILLNREHVSPEALASTLLLLRKLRVSSVAPGRVQIVPIKGSVLADPLPARTRAQLDASLQRLATQSFSRVGNLGRGQWIELPSDRLTR